MRKALILGTNAGQADIINYLKEAEWEVHACGHKKEGPGCHLAHQFHMVNTIDVEAVKNLAKKIKADIVYSVSSDSAIRTVTRVSEELGLPLLLNSEIIDLFHYKDRLRKFLNDNNINTVGFRKLTSIEDLEGWNIIPCVVKPSDSQGQRGVQFIDKQEELYNAVKSALQQSSSGTAIIEEYLEGIEISTNMIIQNGKVIVNEFTERLVFGHSYFGLPKGHSIPIRTIPKQKINEASKVAVKLVEKLNITDAVLYIQMKVTDNGPKIIEVAPRLDGCHIWRLIKTYKGYDLRKYAIDCLTHVQINHKVNQSSNQFTLAFQHIKTGLKFCLDEFKLPDTVVYNEYRYEPDEIVLPINGILEVVGYYIYKD